MIKLGIIVRDKITNFEGIVTGHADYLTGCDQYLVQPPVSKDGVFIEGRWIDEGRLEVVTPNTVIEKEDVSGEKNGADINAPIK